DDVQNFIKIFFPNKKQIIQNILNSDNERILCTANGTTIPQPPIFLMTINNLSELVKNPVFKKLCDVVMTEYKPLVLHSRQMFYRLNAPRLIERLNNNPNIDKIKCFFYAGINLPLRNTMVDQTNMLINQDDNDDKCDYKE
ncbi:unnamed protein product, partial [Didymodactylos carnosus]